MKSFFKILLASLLALSIFFIGGFLVLAAIVGSQEKQAKIDKLSVLTIDANRPILELTPDDPFAELSEQLSGQVSPVNLHSILKSIENAKSDDNIAGIYIKGGTPIAAPAIIQEVRDALKSFKEESGKFIVAYSEIYTENGYFLASVADDIFLNPRGMMDFSGLASEITFFKGTLEKLDVDVQIFRVGEFKSAVEPFFRKDMSEANKKQTASFLNSIYDGMIEQIAESRSLEPNELRTISNEFKVRRPNDALEYKLVSRLAYYDELLAYLRDKLEIDQDADIPSLNVKKYIKTFPAAKYSKNRIAVIVAEGDIVSGSASAGSIGSDKYAKEIRKARLNDRVKAIVLRINSPGGSALASDVMWREVVLASQVKPVIASMSGVAASGGYYMAMACDTIVAHPTTITGSIGIFGLIPNMEKFFENKLGVTFDVVKTGEFSDMMTITRPLNEAEKAIMQEMIEEGYEDFTKKAAEGRNMSHEDLLKVASGRVWSGTEAYERKLVDVLGGLDVAVKIAAEKAGLADDDYATKIYPEEKPFFEKLMEELSANAQMQYEKAKYGPAYFIKKDAEKILNYKGVQARMPYEIKLK